MLFRQKKKIVRLTVFCEDHILYQGPVSEVPLRESKVLEVSTRFFNDPNPCYIHRGAVRVRLTAELEEMMKKDSCPDLAMLREYTGLDSADRALLEEG